jgi:hypothetical protein
MMVYWIDFGLSNVNSSVAWRVPTVLQCVFLILQLLLLPLVPDTARWYASHDRHEEALMVLKRMYGHRESEEFIRNLHADILQTVAVETSIGAGSWKDLLKDDSIHSRHRLFLACGIQIMQQLGGNTAVLCRFPILHSFSLFWFRVGKRERELHADSVQIMPTPCSKTSDLPDVVQA